MADVDAIIAVELFQAHLSGIACREYKQILNDAVKKLFTRDQSRLQHVRMHMGHDRGQ